MNRSSACRASLWKTPFPVLIEPAGAGTHAEPRLPIDNVRPVTAFLPQGSTSESRKKSTQS